MISKDKENNIEIIKRNGKFDSKNGLIFIIMMIVSIFATLYLLIKVPESFGTGYSYLFVLPITFICFLIFTHSCWNEMPTNIGLTILFALEFIRMVVSPVLVAMSGYHNVIEYKHENNNFMGIILLMYESFCIALALKLKNRSKYIQYKNIDDAKSNRKMTCVVILVLIFTVIICYFAPEILKNYRIITGVFTDKEFTNIEQSYIVNKYSFTIVKKFMLITANYVLKVMRILIPAFLMIRLKLHNSKFARTISKILIISPFLFVDGAIARSLYLTLLLLLTYNYLYGIDAKKLYFPIIFAGFLVLIYFTARFKLLGSTNILEYTADKSIDYFAGVNIIGGSCNLPEGIEYRFHYFILDLLRSVPFSNTLFGLNPSDYIQTFFNRNNMMPGGQIPTTIGMGYYYFSFIFSPFYSVLFARMCKKNGEKAIKQKNPYYKLIYYYISFITALGIGMYNIEITLGTLTQVIFPMYILTRISYRKEKKDNDT